MDINRFVKSERREEPAKALTSLFNVVFAGTCWWSNAGTRSPEGASSIKSPLTGSTLVADVDVRGEILTTPRHARNLSVVKSGVQIQGGQGRTARWLAHFVLMVASSAASLPKDVATFMRFPCAIPGKHAPPEELP